MYLKFSEQENTYFCDYYNDKITSTLNFTIKKIEDYGELLDALKQNTIDVFLYHDEDCTLLEGIYKSYIVLNVNIEYNVKTLYLSLKSADIAKEMADLKDSLDKTQTSVTGVCKQIENINEQINPTPIDPSTLSLEDAKAYQLGIVNQECQETIYAGIDVETTKGIEHFDLTEVDQLNITALHAQCMTGITSVPYHSSSNLCREFSAEEMIAIGNKAMEYVVYCTTLCNHIRAWIKRTKTVEDVIQIHFSSTLPDDLKESFNSVMSIGAEKDEPTDEETNETDGTENVGESEVEVNE